MLTKPVFHLTSIDKFMKEKILDLSNKRYEFIKKQTESFNEDTLEYGYEPKEIDVLGKKILILLKKHMEILPVEFIMEELSKLGFAPNLLYDDNGWWAITGDGMQTLVTDSPQDIETSFFVEASNWKPTIKEALKHYLKI